MKKIIIALTTLLALGACTTTDGEHAGNAAEQTNDGGKKE